MLARPELAAQGGDAAGALRRRRVGASAPPPAAAKAWTADPDDQFLLDVNIRQLRLGDGVRAYNTPEGTCVVLGDFLTDLDVPMHIDLGAKKASGWAFKESNRIAIDYAAMTARTLRHQDRGDRARHHPRNARRLVRPGQRAVPLVRDRRQADDRRVGAAPPVGCQAAGRARDGASAARAARSSRRNSTLPGLPQVRIPYRMWRAPALDFVVSAGVTYRASDGIRVDRQSSVYAAGEIARLSYDAQITTNQKGMPSTSAAARLPVRSGRPACSGPLNATHFGVGDVEGFDSKLTGSPACGRGGRDHQPAADRADGVRPDPLRRRPAGRLGGRDLSQRRTARLCQVGRQTSAMSLMTSSFSTARTASASCFTGRRGRSGRARK